MLLDDQTHVDRHASRRWAIGWAVVLVVSVAGLSFFTLRPADAISPSDAENVGDLFGQADGDTKKSMGAPHVVTPPEPARRERSITLRL